MSTMIIYTILVNYLTLSIMLIMRLEWIYANNASKNLLYEVGIYEPIQNKENTHSK